MHDPSRQDVQYISWQRALVLVAFAVEETINKVHFYIVGEVVMGSLMQSVISMVMSVAMFIDIEVVIVIVMGVVMSIG